MALSSDSWQLHTSDRRPWLRSYLGNGRLAVQLVAEGGLAGSDGAPLHLMAELYDRAPDREVEHPVALPDWTTLSLRLDDRPLDPGQAVAYSQTLDLRAGLAHTRHRWRLDGAEVEAEITMAVLRQEPTLALVRCTVQADRPCSLEASKLLAAAGLPGVRDGTAAAEGGRISVAAHTQERGVPLCVAGTLLAPEGEAAWRFQTDLVQTAGVPPAWAARWFTDRSPEVAGAPTAAGDLHPGAVIRGTAQLQPNQPRSVTWLAVVHSRRTAADPRAAAHADLQRAVASGVERLLAEHRAAWAHLWQADVVIDGDDEAQRFVRAGLYALLSSVRPDVPASIAPMGLSSMGYNGHIFWDADTWMFPPLLLLHPDAARAILTYRQDRLPAARARARAEGYQGAMFPWESATDGGETTPASIARTGLKEHHVTACVALAQWQYYLATGDRAWLAERAWPVLQAAAQFWASRATPGRDGGYEIRDVIAADEYAEDVDNDAFTNGAARAALRAAVDAARLLGHTPPPEWQRVADGLVLARDGDLVLEYDGYDGRVIKQGDVELLTFPLEHPLTEAGIAINLDTYRRATDPNGPAMGRSISAVVAAQLGRRDEALRLFHASYRPHLWGPFYALAETPTNGVVNFLTGVGGALQSLLFGFAGIRLHRDCLAVDPLLPGGWRALRFPSIHWRGQVISLAVLPGDRCEIGVTLAGIACTLALRRWRPGPEALTVALQTDAPCWRDVTADGWRVQVAEADRSWRLLPPPGGLTASWVRLHLTLRTEQGQEAAFAVEQRVCSGDLPS